MTKPNVIYDGWDVTNNGTVSGTDTSKRNTYSCCRCGTELKSTADGNFGSYCGADCQGAAMIEATMGAGADTNDELLIGVLNEVFSTEFVQRKIHRCEVCNRQFFARRKDKKRCSPACEGKAHNSRRRKKRELQRGNVSLFEQWEIECSGDEDAWVKRVADFCDSAGISKIDEASFVLTQIEMQKKCDHCQTLYKPRRSDSRFCSTKCRVAAKRQREKKTNLGNNVP